jgi:hypothetical protein
MLICGPNLIGAIGIDMKFYYAAIMFLCVPLIFYNKNYVLKNKSLLCLLLFCTTYGIMFMFYDKSEGSRYTALVIMSTPIFFSAFPHTISRKWSYYSFSSLWLKFMKLFMFFFLLETILASIERILGFNIFGWQLTEGEMITEAASDFRSTSLHGHPLYNALIVSTSMAFILTSRISMRSKLMLWMLGFFSILCFNTRSSIVGNALLFIIFVVYTLLRRDGVAKQDKRLLAFMAVVFSLVGGILFFVLGFGSRLMDMGLFDESSSMARVNVFDVFDYYPFEDFLWGMDFVQYEYAMYYAGLEIIENFYVAYILRNGFVFLVVYVLLYIWLVKSLYRGYDSFTKWFTCGAFVIIASTNNSLSTLGIALFLFLMLIIMFNPKMTNITEYRKS